jgi:hydrogenase maturation protease
MNYLVLGIGQSLRGDDAAGLEAVRLWQIRFPGSAARVRVEIQELPGVGLLDLLEGMGGAVIVDAVKSKAPVGTLMLLGHEKLVSFEPGTGSAHGWGVAETLHLGYQIYPEFVNCQITLIGIVGGQFDMGEALSPKVRKVMPEAAQLIENEVEKWS